MSKLKNKDPLPFIEKKMHWEAKTLEVVRNLAQAFYVICGKSGVCYLFSSAYTGFHPVKSPMHWKYLV